MLFLSRFCSPVIRKTLTFATSKTHFATRTREVKRSHFAQKPNIKASAKEFAQKGTSNAPFAIGQGVVAGAAALGLGALCVYGLAGSSKLSTMDLAVTWPAHVRQRIHETYAYFGSSILLTAGSAAAVFRTPGLFRVVASGGWPVMIGSMIALIGSGMVCQSMPFPEHGFGAKHLAWALHSSIMGAVVAPLCIMGGPIITRAALYTLGVVGGLSALAVTAPSEKFLTMGGPLAIGLGVVVVSSLGSMFLSPMSALGAGLYSISLYGGLVVFSGFLLYDTQKIIKKAEEHPPPGYMDVAPYDPINNSIGIYLDTMNIFIRIAVLLSGGGNKRR